MDNRKWYNRFATIFWWSLTILPLIIALIYFIGYHLTFNSGITSATELSSYHMNDNSSFINYLNTIFASQGIFTFSPWSISYFTNMYSNLFSSIGVSYSLTLGRLLSWMTSVQFYHLIFDFIVWLPQWFHRIMEKGMDKLS